MPNKNDKFLSDVIGFTIKAERITNDVRKFIAYEMFSRVVDRTPIYFSYEPTSGNTKFNWQCTLGKPSTRILKGTDQTGKTTKDRMKKVLDIVKGDETIYFANSVPHILILEDGLYPKSVSKGSYNKQTGKYEIRSSGGYSKMAPTGMVKVTVLAFSSVSKSAIKKAQNVNR